MQFEKKLPDSCHRRRVPTGFGWVDHRFLRNGHMRNCSLEGFALYLLLITAADGDCVSFYGDSLICRILGINRSRLEEARNNLLEGKLIAWDQPFYQVLEIQDNEV